MAPRMARMRIAYFSDTFLPQINGVSNTLSYLKAYLDRKNIEYRFHVPDYDDETLKNDPWVVCSRGVPLPVYSDCRVALPWLPRLQSNMDAFRPDLIHLATEFGVGVMGRYYARAKRGVSRTRSTCCSRNPIWRVRWGGARWRRRTNVPGTACSTS